MTIDPQRAAGSSTVDGKTYYFCSTSCKAKFDADPHQAQDLIAPPPQKIEWTCPMHPQIVRDGPGNCPICGMALEPRTITAEEPENPELADMTQRFWIAVVLSVPLLVIAMAGMRVGAI